MIQHDDQFDPDWVNAEYGPCKYVLTSELPDGQDQVMDIFYRDTPHPEFGNHYFGLFKDQYGRVTIANADSIDGAVIAMIEEEDNLHYSSHRHDFKQINGSMVDGGRSYIRARGAIQVHEVVDGEVREFRE